MGADLDHFCIVWNGICCMVCSGGLLLPWAHLFRAGHVIAEDLQWSVEAPQRYLHQYFTKVSLIMSSFHNWLQSLLRLVDAFLGRPIWKAGFDIVSWNDECRLHFAFEEHYSTDTIYKTPTNPLPDTFCLQHNSAQAHCSTFSTTDADLIHLRYNLNWCWHSGTAHLGTGCREKIRIGKVGPFQQSRGRFM